MNNFYKIKTYNIYKIFKETTTEVLIERGPDILQPSLDYFKKLEGQ